MRSRRFRASILAATLGVSAVSLAACGAGSDDSSDAARAVTETPGQVLKLTVKPSPGKMRGVVNLRPGAYVYYCAVGGHWQLGQHGKLVVQ